MEISVACYTGLADLCSCSHPHICPASELRATTTQKPCCNFVSQEWQLSLGISVLVIYAEPALGVWELTSIGKEKKYPLDATIE